MREQPARLRLKRREKSLHERAFEKIDVAKELRRLVQLLEDLKIQYEQFFLGLTLYQPDKLHREVRMLIRRLRKAPFKKPRHKYRLRSLESRYHTYHDYWQRVLRQREEGIYVKDVFKANLHERFAQEDHEAQTRKGGASKAMHALFHSYKQAVEKQTGKAQRMDFNAFQKALLRRARAEQEKHGKGKLSFKVLVRDGKVIVKATLKKKAPPAV